MRHILRFAPVLLMMVIGIALGDWLHVQRTAAAVPDAAAADSAVAQSSPAAVGPLTSIALPNQFFVPIVRNGNLRSTMILGLGMEVREDRVQAVHAQEFRLRDALLRALMVHANTGGFDGNFTSEPHLRLLGEVLLVAAQKVAGSDVQAILIGDIARQDP